jgi:phage-related protein
LVFLFRKAVITIELFKLFGTIFVNNDEANKALDDTDQKAEATGGKFEKLGGIAKGVGGVIAAGVGVASVAVGGLMTKAMETTFEINKFSQVTGMSKEGFQEWDSVAKTFGFSMEAAAGDMAALAERGMDAASGAGENAEMFKKLGVSVTDSNGKLKTQEELFNDTIKGLQGMENETERNAIATAMLSTTGEELAPVLNMTNEELQKMKDNANVISDDDLAKAEEFRLKWEGAKSTFSGIVTQIGLKLMPMFSTVLDWVVTNMPAIQSTMDKVFSVLSTVVNVAVGVFRDYFLPVLSQVWSFIQENLVPIFTSLFNNVQGNFPVIKEVFTSVFGAIWETAKTVWSIFKDSILPIFVSLYTWISGHMPTIRETFMTVFSKIKEVVSGVWAFFKDNILPIFQRLVEFVQSKMPQIQSIIETVFRIIADVVRIVWDVFENVLLPVLKALWDWVKPYIPKIQKIIEDTFTVIFDVVKVVVDVFEDVVDAVKKAIDWLTFWDDKKVKKKTIEVEERRTSAGGSKTPGYAIGTNYHPGGYAVVGERGAELLDLPRGTKVKTANQTSQFFEQEQKSKQPIIIQMVTPDKRVLAEMVVDDVTEIQGFKTNRTKTFEGGLAF